MNQDRRLVNINQACEIAGVSRRTIYNWLQTGKVETLRTAGGSVRIYADTLFRRPSQGEDSGLGLQGSPNRS